MKENIEQIVDVLFRGKFYLEEAVELLEKVMIGRALQESGGNQSAASKVLGIHRNTLQRKMEQYGIAGARPRRKPAGRAAAKPLSKRKAV